MIRIHNLSHYFGKKHILLGLDLEVQTGELLAVMGPNGVGKSTLLAAIAGLIQPSEGTVEINGKLRRSSVEDEMAIRREMVYLPPSPWMAMQMDVYDWLYHYGQLYRVPAPKLIDHIDRLLALFHLEEHRRTNIKDCSTGQQKKVAICGALIAETPYLVLDEPFTGGLDPSAIRALERVLKHLAEREDRTVVISSQVPELVEAVADRVVVINDQKLVGVGTIDELREQTGCAGSLGEVFERLTRPVTDDEVDRYLQIGGAV